MLYTTFMKLIVGLGNPGEKYKDNRHNVGFMFVDYLADQSTNPSTGQSTSQSTNWKFDKYLQADICTVSYQLPTTNYQLTLAKPQTFMNLSGTAVKKLTTHYQLPTTNLFIAHDDLDIPLGKFKIQLASGPKIHNGITSVENSLQTNNFYRIRIGVDNRSPERRIPGETYALQDFTKEEYLSLQNIFQKIMLQLQSLS
jgi:peptidyl-tRNA hydrolase, PTH1 family